MKFENPSAASVATDPNVSVAEAAKQVLGYSVAVEDERAGARATGRSRRTGATFGPFGMRLSKASPLERAAAVLPSISEAAINK